MSPGTVSTASQAIDAVVFLVPGTVAQDGALRLHDHRLRARDQQERRARRHSRLRHDRAHWARRPRRWPRRTAGGGDRDGLPRVHHPEQQLGQSDRAAPRSSTTQGPASPSRAAAGRAAALRRPSRPPTSARTATSRTAPTTPGPTRGLPKQISAMQSAMTTSVGPAATAEEFNATYDVWFAKISADRRLVQRRYLRVPHGLALQAGQQAAHRQRSRADGDASLATPGTSGSDRAATRRRVRTLLRGRSFRTLRKTRRSPACRSTSRTSSTTPSANADTSNGVTGPFSSSWYLTDVFAGFEIWSGGNATNLKSTGFSCVVK